MSDRTWVVVLLVALVLAVGITGYFAAEYWRERAIVQGHAEYYFSRTTGEREWRWLPAPNEKGAD